MQGKNIAEIKDSMIFECHKQKNIPCVFISHKKDDEDVAIALGNYITNILGMDIYLDIYDTELQKAVLTEGNNAIVSSIQKGLESSTHLVCIVSNKTKISWWVPYEIGFAERNLKGDSIGRIASVKLSYISDFPEFLKIKKTISSTNELIAFLKETRYSILTESRMDEKTRERMFATSSPEYKDIKKYFG